MKYSLEKDNLVQTNKYKGLTLSQLISDEKQKTKLISSNFQ